MNCTSALDSVAALICASFFAPWQTDCLVRSIAQQAFHHNYEGEWVNVQILLENEDQSSKGIMDKACELYGPRAYYGNLVSRCEKLLRRIKFKSLTTENTQPIHKGQRVRGYRDKGSRRLPHEFHGDPPLTEQREDRRNLVRHPLVGDWEEIQDQNRNMLEFTAPKKGDEQDEYND